MVDSDNLSSEVDDVNPPPLSSRRETLKQQTTKSRLVEAALKMLDAGGPDTVTLRGVAEIVGLSHNAPYKHFKDKNALLIAAATLEFRRLNKTFARAAHRSVSPLSALQTIVEYFIAYSNRFPARYRLLFSDPAISQAGGELENQALLAFAAVATLVSEAQRHNQLRAADPTELTALLYSALHGMIDIRSSGRAREVKGFRDLKALSTLLLAMMK